MNCVYGLTWELPALPHEVSSCPPLTSVWVQQHFEHGSGAQRGADDVRDRLQHHTQEGGTVWDIRGEGAG